MDLEKNWRKEVARDIIALGSIPFYAIVITRMFLTPEFSLLIPRLVFAFIAVLLFSYFIAFNQYLARGFILVSFTTLGYRDVYFGVGAGLLWLGMIWSLIYLRENKDKIVKGAIAGIIASAIGYYLTLALF